MYTYMDKHLRKTEHGTDLEAEEVGLGERVAHLPRPLVWLQRLVIVCVCVFCGCYMRVNGSRRRRRLQASIKRAPQKRQVTTMTTTAHARTCIHSHASRACATASASFSCTAYCRSFITFARTVAALGGSALQLSGLGGLSIAAVCVCVRERMMRQSGYNKKRKGQGTRGGVDGNRQNYQKNKLTRGRQIPAPCQRMFPSPRPRSGSAAIPV